MRVKNKILVLLAAMCFLLAACGACKHEYDEGTVTKEATCTEEGIKSRTCTICKETVEEAVPVIDHDYGSETTKEATFVEVGTLTYTCKVCGDSYTEDIPVKEKSVVVTVTDKINHPVDVMKGSFSDSVQLIFNIENQCDEDVQGIEGTLTVTDLFGEEIIVTECDFTGQTIPANASAEFSDIGMDINQFKENHTKFYNEKFSDLSFAYEVKNIITAGGTSDAGTAGGETEQDAPVSIVVTDKINLPKDIMTGRISDAIQLTINVENKSDKAIKGIQGVLTVNDLFDKKINSFSCEFTGQTIAAGSTATFDDLGMDVNQFLEDEVKLFNENFSDLKFSYKIGTIIYEDGTTEEFK